MGWNLRRSLAALGMSVLVVAGLPWLGPGSPSWADEKPQEVIPGEEATAEAAGYVGSDFCASCHEGYEEKLAETPHGRSGFGALSSRGCESCHGPGSLHVEDPEIVTNQPRLYALPAKEQNAVCQTCHEGSNRFFWQGGRHETRGLSCLSCHSVHSYEVEKGQLNAVNETEQCFTCHQDVRAETWKTSHHPIREGKMSCSDCHNPHGSQSDKMITAASVNEQCYSCHAEKRGPFLWDHPPVRENCASCHTPHGSNHLKLQKTSVPYLCQQCHSNTRHPGTLYDRSTLADGTRPSNRDFSRACLNCHGAIHGSNHPSSPYLAH
ncbi:MAG: DmsE family decaheme c-type cytochrome [Deltaproteobacteria bacterium]|nr:DmsE family decaheme c-type cytochrome [Deltaproteobacteria bacterium]